VAELILTPSGHVALVDGAEPAAVELPGALAESLRRAYGVSPSELLLQLSTAAQQQPLAPAFKFWGGFAERYLTALCHIPESVEGRLEPVALPAETVAGMLEAPPPFRGAEYLASETLTRIWDEMDAYARAEIAAEKGGLSAWLRRRSPLWQRVGRVCFHLAENKRDAEYPFAFLATYAPKLLDGRRVQYLPLGKALEEYAGAKHKATLINLLTPVQRAAEKCAWVRTLVDLREVFQPLRWTPPEAHRLLHDIPLLEESGLLVRVPDWWSKRPPRVRVSVAIGAVKGSDFGADAMLDFNAGLTLDGEPLSTEEWQRVLDGADGLVLLKGKWVEVDREKLTRALEQWQAVAAEAGSDGISFLQGMRMLAGASLDPETDALFSGEGAAWSEVHAGPWLAERLQELRQPGVASVPAALRATLRPYQEAGVAWLDALTRLQLGACLADDMGLGKTIQVLALLLLRKQRGPAQPPALLILPASLLANWKSEAEKFAPSLQCRFVHPSQLPAAELQKAAENPAAFVAGADLVLTTFSMVARLNWLNALAWSLIVVDEAQALKNPGARQTRAVKQLKGSARIALTGTPVENRLSDLWSIFDFVNPGLLGSVKSFREFVKRLETRAEGQFAPLRNLVKPYILRRLKSDKSIVNDLPDKVELQAYCNLSHKQAALYEKSVNELARALESADGIQRRGIVLGFIMRFKQICNHPAHWLGSGDYAPDESGKFRRLREICEELAERQERALIFTQFREMTEPLAAFLGGIFGRAGLVLHGGTDVKRRKNIVDEFQSENGPPFLVLSLKAGGTGLNLTAATQVLHFDRWWNPAVENQATDRAYRIGQKKNVVVHKFVCQGTIEEKIDALIRDKSKLAGEILEGGVPTLVTELSDAELLNLVKLDVNTIAED
jgi:non-specific serine/threonine protein kinase